MRERIATWFRRITRWRRAVPAPASPWTSRATDGGTSSRPLIVDDIRDDPPPRRNLDDFFAERRSQVRRKR